MSALSKDLGSFVSFALAVKPEVIMHRHCEKDPLRGGSVKLAFGKKALQKNQVDTLESLMKRFEPLKAYLAITDHPDDKRGFDIKTCAPRGEFQPNTEYALISIYEKQLSIAKRIAQMAEKTHASYQAGRHDEAKSNFAELQRTIEAERRALVGDFAKIDRVSGIVGLHGVGQNGNPAADWDCGGAVIFVIIEIFVAFAPDREIAFAQAA